MPQIPFITTLVEDNEVNYMPGMVSKYAVCNYAGVARLGFLCLQWKTNLLVECYSGKLLILTKCSEQRLPNIKPQI